MSGVGPPALAFALTLSCIMGTGVAAATRYDSRLRFRTISTARFDIHFHQGEDAIANRLAGFVEAAAADVDRAVGAAVGRVQIILVDQHDLSNGWATPLPYNTIEISAASPSAENSIGNTDDWLRLVFIHEYTHIAHLSRATGWIGGLRRPFGRLPLLFPNLYQPLWGIEGLATWREGEATQRGRVAAGDFRQLIDRAAAADRFEPIDRTNGGNVDWPSGAIPYVYGAYFYEYLEGRYGAESIRKLADETSRRLPYLGSRAYKKVFGRSLGRLWEDFATMSAGAADSRPSGPITAVRLTRHGFAVRGPRYGPDGRLFYSATSPHHFPALMELVAGGQPRHIGQRYLGNAIAIAGDRLLVDEIEMVRSVGLKSDLYVVDPHDGTRWRLTREARAADPDLSRSRVVVCTLQQSDRRALGIFTLPNAPQIVSPEILISEPSTDFAAPRWSPDGRAIAAERRRVGGSSQIVVIDASTRHVRVAADLPGGRSAAPAWMPDGRRVLFSSAVGSEPFRIYSVDLETGAVSRLEGTGPSAQTPDVSPDGRSLVYVGYTIDGYDLFSMSLATAQWTIVEGNRAAGRDRATEVAIEPVAGTRRYSPWRTLAPHFWTPTIESDAGEVVLGAATGSVDALGRHAYGIEAGWSARARPDWQFAYAYDRWRPTFFLSASDDTDPWRLGLTRTREVDSGILLRAASVRVTHATLAALHIGRDTFACATCSPAVEADLKRVSIRAGWEFSSAKSFGYSISAEEGHRVAVTVESTRRAFGADGDGFAMTTDARAYWRAGPRHAVFASRAAAAGSWGDRDAERQFSAAGPGPQTSGFGFGTDAIGLLRGFDSDDVTGTRAVVVNADFRVPLARVDRGVGTLPVFLRALHGAVFVDAGTAWVEGARWTDTRVSIGAELSVDTVVGFALPLTVTVGGAWRRDGAQGERRFVAFGRIGRAF